MGVKACFRTDCDNIMCDTLLNGHYVCQRCLDEFEVLCQGWDDEMTQHDILSKVREFYATPANSVITTNTKYFIDSLIERNA